MSARDNQARSSLVTPVREITGLGVSPGQAAGPIIWMSHRRPEPDDSPRPITIAVDEETERLARATGQVHKHLLLRAERASGEAAAVLETTAMMVMDPTLKAAAEQVIAQGATAQRAIWVAAGQVSGRLSALGGYLAERARDVDDVRDRIVACLTGQPEPGLPQTHRSHVLVADDLAPADTATLDPATTVALVTAKGGPQSHTAILARSLGIPAVVAAPEVTELSNDVIVMVDGSAGLILVAPHDEALAAAERSTSRRTNLAHFNGTCQMRDGTPVNLLANVGNEQQAQLAESSGAAGVGLFRTEFCFLDQRDAPSIEKQATIYTRVLKPFAGRKTVIRTLDAGSDKPLPFVDETTEPNPALGVRGYRTSTGRRNLLTDQLTAIALAGKATGAHIQVMAPMISTATEAREFRILCHRAGIASVGVMVEVPSAALEIESIMREVDFVSLGTNDLTQYVMAADRQLGALAELNDPWQPAVLKLIHHVVRGAATVQAERPGTHSHVGVCGEAAADPLMAAVLIGLGLRDLSMSARAIPDVAHVLSSLDHTTATQLAEAVLTATTPTQARQIARAQLPAAVELGL